MYSKDYNKAKFNILSSFCKSDCPVAISGSLDKMLMEWKSSLYSLALAFISIVHQTLPSGNVLNFLKDAVNTFVSSDNFMDSFDVQQAELIYYIAGWILCATEKEIERRGNNPIVIFF